MKVKAKYICMLGTCYRYFHNKKEMDEFFNNHRSCHLISVQAGEKIRQEAEKIGLF